jgi:hypothetical protein
MNNSRNKNLDGKTTSIWGVDSFNYKIASTEK